MHWNFTYLKKSATTAIACGLLLVASFCLAAENGGERDPDPESLGPMLKLGQRQILLAVDKSVEAGRDPSRARFFVEPTLDPVQVENPPIPELPSVFRVRTEKEETFLGIRFSLTHQDVLDAAAKFIEVVESAQLQRLAAANAVNAVNVVVEPLPVRRLKIDLARRVDLHLVLASAEAEVTRAVDYAELWFKVDSHALEQLKRLASDNDLAFVPSYSFAHRRMAEAVLLNSGELRLRDEFDGFLSSTNLTGNADILQEHLNDFSQELEVVVQSRIYASHPEAASVLVNNITQFSGMLVDKGSQLPFAEYAGMPSASQEALARSLAHIGWQKKEGMVFEHVNEQRDGQQSGSIVHGKVTGTSGDDSGKLAATVGGAVNDQTLQSTLERTGIQLTYSQDVGGYVIATLKVYTRLKDLQQSRFEQSCSVTIGLGTQPGLIGGTPFGEEWTTQEVEDNARKAYKELTRLQGAMAATLDVLSADAQYLEGVQRESAVLQDSLLQLSEQINQARDVAEALAQACAKRGDLNGQRDAYSGTGNTLFARHDPIDHEEAAESHAWYNANVATPNLARIDRERAGVDEEIRAILGSRQRSDAARYRSSAAINETLATLSQQQHLLQSLEPIRKVCGDNARQAIRDELRSLDYACQERSRLQAELDGLLQGLLVESKSAVSEEALARTLYDALASREEELAYRRSRRHHHSVASSAYTHHVLEAHDRGEAIDLQDWFNAEHQAVLNREHTAAEAAQAQSATDREMAAGHERRMNESIGATTSTLTPIKQQVGQCVSINREFESSLRRIVARLVD